jgi:hypothetical protein
MASLCKLSAGVDLASGFCVLIDCRATIPLQLSEYFEKHQLYSFQSIIGLKTPYTSKDAVAIEGVEPRVYYVSVTPPYNRYASLKSVV